MTSKNKSIIASIIVWASLFVVVPFLFKYLLYTTVGIDYWAEYESVEPIKDSFEVGETLIFKSISEKYRPAFIEWHRLIVLVGHGGRKRPKHHLHVFYALV